MLAVTLNNKLPMENLKRLPSSSDSDEFQEEIRHKSKKSKRFASDLTTNGIDSTSGTSFADALGMCAPVYKKKSSVERHKASSCSSNAISSKTKGEKPDSESIVNSKLLQEPVSEALAISRQLGGTGFDNLGRSSSSSDSDEFQEGNRHISKKESHKSSRHSKDKESKEKQSSSKRKPGEDSDVDDSKSSKICTRENKKVKLFAPTDGIDSASGASFADALGMCAPLPVYKKKFSVAKPKASSSSLNVSSSKNKPVSGPLGIESILANITPNRGNIGFDTTVRRTVTDDEITLSRVISSKNQRTKVYSGNKIQSSKVPTLFELCARTLQDYIDALEYTGGVPYSVLKPIFEKANPDQLYMIEHHNPYLIEDTGELWQLHCQREFKTKCREEMETWRDLYIRCLDEREAKLKALTANIKMSQDMSLPVRTTKLAYVDSIVKPPRNIMRKQMINGTTADKVAVPNPGVKVEESSRSSSSIKPAKKAPLMQKALSIMKNRFKR